MPYPIVHMLFFIFSTSSVAVYATVRSVFHKGTSFGSSMRLTFLLIVGSLCSIFPDIPAVYNLLVNGNMHHCWIGSFPTHSLVFSSLAIIFGVLAGYTAYRKVSKAIYLGLFGEAAFFSHLLLDDACGGSCSYFYPVYNRPISLFSIMNIGFEQVGLLHYLMISFVSVSFVCFFIAMALFSLNQFGFEFKYRS
jgi:membrane-bound metal-dependent hydrolase YbcI (DUF457 family)